MMPIDMQMRDAFISTLYEYAVKKKNIIFLSCEYGAPSLDRFRAKLGNQFINAGISEQNLISVAAGMAMQGKRVYVYSIASFVTLRCLEQVKLDLCAMDLPVTIVAVGPSYAYGEDGPTHHATEDIAVMRALARMSIYSPSDSQMSADLVSHTLKSSGPVYCRLDKGSFPNLSPCQPIHWNQGYRTFNGGSDMCVIATGNMVHRGLEIRSACRNHGIGITVIDLFRPKPLSVRDLAKKMRNFDRILTIEEHTNHGGIGSLIAEVVAEAELAIPFKRIAINDGQLYAYGNRDRLHTERRLDCAGLVDTILKWHSEKR